MSDGNVRLQSRVCLRRMASSGDGAGCISLFDKAKLRKLLRVSKGILPGSSNPLKCHAALQSLALVLASAMLLVYICSGGMRQRRAWTDRSYDSSQQFNTGYTTFPTVRPPAQQTDAHSHLYRTAPVQAQLLSTIRTKVLETVTKLVRSAGASVAQGSNETRSAPTFPVVVEFKADRQLETFSDPTATSSQPSICRIYGGCIGPDGEVYLDPMLKVHDDVLRQCGLADVVYTKRDASTPTSLRRDEDFFTVMLRSHMPHLASDVLSFSHAVSAISGAFGLTEELPERSKLLKPVINVDDRILRMSADSWSNKVLRMFPLGTKVESLDQMFPGTSSSMQCFRSIISFQQQIYWQVSPARFGHSNHFFKDNGLRLKGEGSVVRPARIGNQCAPRIVVLNRDPDDFRNLANIGDVTRQFESLLQSPRFRNLSRATLQVKYMNGTFEEQVRTVKDADVVLASHGAALANLIFARTFTPVVEVYPFCKYWAADNPSNFLLAHSIQFDSLHLSLPHSLFSSLRWLIHVGIALARPKSAARMALRLVPSGVVLCPGDTTAYYAQIFAAMADAMGLRYEMVVAEPDTERFFGCMKELNGWQQGTTDAAASRLAQLRSTWSRAIAAAKRGDYSALGTHNADSVGGLQAIRGLRQCGRSQQLRVNAPQLATRLLELASGVCNNF